MMGRFFKVFGLILAFMGAWGVVLILLVVLAEGDEEVLLFGILPATVLIFITFVPYLNAVSKRVFRFPGEGEPVSEDELRARILAINDFDAPVMVEERGRKLVVTWKYVDSRWWELLAKAGLQKIYELHVKLDGDRHRATLSDVTRSVKWRTGPSEVRVAGAWFRGIALEAEFGKQWGIRENFELGKIHDYTFSSAEIRNPVLNTILRSGWEVRLGMW